MYTLIMVVPPHKILLFVVVSFLCLVVVLSTSSSTTAAPEERQQQPQGHEQQQDFHRGVISSTGASFSSSSSFLTCEQEGKLRPQQQGDESNNGDGDAPMNDDDDDEEGIILNCRFRIVVPKNRHKDDAEDESSSPSLVLRYCPEEGEGKQQQLSKEDQGDVQLCVRADVSTYTIGTRASSTTTSTAATFPDDGNEKRDNQRDNHVGARWGDTTRTRTPAETITTTTTTTATTLKGGGGAAVVTEKKTTQTTTSTTNNYDDQTPLASTIETTTAADISAAATATATTTSGRDAATTTTTKTRNDDDPSSFKNNGRQQQHDDDDAFLSKYRRPYDEHYHPHVVIALSRQATRRIYRNDPLVQADWYMELGLAHRAALEELLDTGPTTTTAQTQDGGTTTTATSNHHHDNNNGKSNNNKVWFDPLQQEAILLGQESDEMRTAMTMALEAFRAGLDALDDNDEKAATTTTTTTKTTRSTLLQSRARILFEMGETCLFSTDRERILESISYFERSKDLYRTILDENENENNNDDAEYDDDKHDIVVGWGHTSARLGASLLSLTSTLVTTAEQNNDYDDTSSDGTTTQEGLRLQKAKDALQQAVEVFTAAAARRNQNPGDRVTAQLHAAGAHQHLSTACMLTSDWEGTAAHGEASAELYNLILQRGAGTGTQQDMQDALVSLASITSSLYTTYLQMGKYELSAKHYRAVMRLYQEHDWLAPPEDQMMAPGMNIRNDNNNEEEDTSLSAYEEVLEAYHELVETNGASSMGEQAQQYDADGYLLSYRDDGYEGDLHAGLGAMYVSRGDSILARSHLEEAVRLYRNTGEQGEINMADVLFNMAILDMTVGDYGASADRYQQAMDVYEHMVQERGEEPPEFYADMGAGGVGGMEDLLAAYTQQQQQQGQTSNHDNKGTSAGTSTTSRAVPASGKDTANNNKKKSDHTPPLVQESLIDLESYRQSILNATTTTATSSAREEL